VISPSQRPLPTYNIETQETNIHALSGIRTRDPSNQAAADLRLRPRGYRGRHEDSSRFEALVPACKATERHNPKGHHRHARLSVFTAASMNMTAFWDTMPCSLVAVDRRFRGAYRLENLKSRQGLVVFLPTLLPM
jgi:hypothetical protein